MTVKPYLANLLAVTVIHVRKKPKNTIFALKFNLTDTNDRYILFIAIYGG
jgi:hypothetical protein